jgi:5-hydroxyisourate hydrolase-like protein (transthyretin family)
MFSQDEVLLDRQLKTALHEPDNTQTGHIEIRQLDIVRLPGWHALLVMFIKFIWIGFVGIMAFVAGASAASSVLQGIVRDASGHPIQGADIRVEATNTGRLLTTVKTNANGRYNVEGLAAGDYRVTLVVNGAVKASINNATLVPDESTHLNFDMKQTRASVTLTKGKHRVWMPAFTGSRLPGRWVEVDGSGSWAAANATANHVVRVSAEELSREVHNYNPGDR